VPALKDAFARRGARWNVTVEIEFFLTAGLLSLSGAGIALVDPTCRWRISKCE
jgi:hypothetical protein